MKTLAILCLLHCGIGMGLAQLPRTSWPMINGDATRSSYANINMNLPLRIADTFHINYDQENGMALWDNKLFIADAAASNRLVVTDVITGDSLWSFDVPGTVGSMQFIPAVSEGVVLVSGQQADGLYALDAMTGDSLWFLPVGGMYARSPLISDSLVFFCVFDSLVCANLHSGKVHWSYIGNTHQISPAADEQHIYFSGNSTLYALDKFTGNIAWINDSISVGSFLTLGVDSQFLYTGYQTTITAVNKLTGVVDWSMELDTNQRLVELPGAFAQTKDYLLVKYLENGQDKNQFLLLHKGTGQEIIRYTGIAMNYSAPTIINDYLVEFYQRNIMLLDLVSGEVAFSMSDIPVGDHTSQVIAANDKIYIAGSGPNVIVLEGTTTAVHQQENDPVSCIVYPNPALDQLNLLLDLDIDSHLSIELFTPARVLVNSWDPGTYSHGQHSLSLPLGDIKPGFYYLRLQAMRGDVVKKVVIIE